MHYSLSRSLLNVRLIDVKGQNSQKDTDPKVLTPQHRRPPFQRPQ